tara:strand:+ start:330682 stop:330858 length:177 start_codon:yes stop_codon:yes gene_type:complete
MVSRKITDNNDFLHIGAGLVYVRFGSVRKANFLEIGKICGKGGDFCGQRSILNGHCFL